MKHSLTFLYLLLMFSACQPADTDRKKIRLIILDPGHFHASLVQKEMSPEIVPHVHVYAPSGMELDSYQEMIRGYNNRADNPTVWNMTLYNQPDYLEKMAEEKRGNVVMLAGNNKNKETYISRSLEAGFNVLCDKPMAINYDDFKALEKSYDTATEKGLLLYDMMTERYEETNSVLRILMQSPELFGIPVKGTSTVPAIESTSVHHFIKTVSGNSLIRPAWYYDTMQQGEGIVDVTTHLIDLINYNCFPEESINYKENVRVLDAGRYPTRVSIEDFALSTGLNEFPDFLRKDVKDGALYVYSNGFIRYVVNDMHIRVQVKWDVQPPAGGGDTHSFIARGTKASLFILQGPEQAYKPQLYIQKEEHIDEEEFQNALRRTIEAMQEMYPGVRAGTYKDKIHIYIPDELKKGHEAHFAMVVQAFTGYLQTGTLPEWEIQNTLTKYYITTKALEIAKSATF